MHPKNHANLLRFYNAIRHPIGMFVSFILVVILLFSTRFRSLLPFIFWLSYIILLNVLSWTDLPWNLPVHCDKPGCNGTVEKIYTEKTNNEAQIQYKCSSCSSVYETIIHLPPDLGDDIRPW